MDHGVSDAPSSLAAISDFNKGLGILNLSEDARDSLPS